MFYIPFNSRKHFHKKPFGAIRSGETVTLRVILPREFLCRAVWLVIHRDDRSEWNYIPFEWERMEGDNEEWWRISYSPETAGLFWYHFEYDTDWGRMRINCVGNGVGKITNDGTDWQLTVCEESFSTPEWIKGGIIYQIFPDRFFASGSPKNNVPDDRILRNDWGGAPMWEPDEDGRITRYDYFGGDLEGISRKLPYLAELGVSCIYLNPVFEAHTNHRYDTADYEKIDPLLGTEKDLQRLCKNAEVLGIKIILDGVFSHTGADSVYFNKYNRYDSVGAYNSQESPFYEWYNFRKWPDEYDCWWGVDILPEVNEKKKSFIGFLTGKNGVLLKWMKLGVSGWRLDVADELPDKLLDSLHSAVKKEKSDAYILGEVWEDATNKYSYGERRRYLLGQQLDSVMNYPFADAIISFLKNGAAESFMEKTVSVLENYPKPSIDTLMNHIGTHDTVRAITQLAGKENVTGAQRRSNDLTPEQRILGVALMKCASALQFTLPGVPCIYYGDEAGLEGGADPFNRRCYPWGGEDSELLSWYTSLGKIRRENNCFTDGEFIPISATLGCVAYMREKSGCNVITIVNRNEHEICYTLPDTVADASMLLGDGFINGNTVTLKSCSAAILSVHKI